MLLFLSKLIASPFIYTDSKDKASKFPAFWVASPLMHQSLNPINSPPELYSESITCVLKSLPLPIRDHYLIRIYYEEFSNQHICLQSQLLSTSTCILPVIFCKMQTKHGCLLEHLPQVPDISHIKIQL